MKIFTLIHVDHNSYSSDFHGTFTTMEKAKEYTETLVERAISGWFDDHAPDESMDTTFGRFTVYVSEVQYIAIGLANKIEEKSFMETVIHGDDTIEVSSPMVYQVPRCEIGEPECDTCECEPCACDDGCGRCDERGKLYCPHEVSITVCQPCEGSGMILNEEAVCAACNGEGRLLVVDIPPVPKVSGREFTKDILIKPGKYTEHCDEPRKK